MRPLLVLLFAALPCAAVTASPTSITVYMRKGYVQGTYPFLATRLPMETEITVSGTGDWNLARGGSLATGCEFGGHCFNAVSVVGLLCSDTLVTGNGPGAFSLCWRKSNGAEFLAVGPHTGTLEVGSTTINITLHVLAPFAYDAFVDKAGYPSGCSNTAAGYPHADTCTITNERPDSTSFSIPAAGGCYIDPQFGNEVCRVTPSGYNIQYSALSAFSASGAYLLVFASDGVHVFNRATATAAYGPLPGEINISKVAWDALDDDLLWYMDGDSLFTRKLSTAAITKRADYGASSGSRPAMATISMGGSSSITDDNWWVIWDGGVSVCAVNLNGIIAVGEAGANQESRTYCLDATGLGLINLDFPQITKVDRGTGKRYVVLMADPAAHVYSVGATALDYEYAIPTGLPNMVAQPHSDVGEDADGTQVLFYIFYDPYGTGWYPAILRLSAGTLLEQPAEIGGGLRILYPKRFGAATDSHVGGNGRGSFILSSYSNQQSARRIPSVTAANPCQIATTGDHGYTTGNTVQIGGALGITSINGEWTITVTGATTYTLDGHNCTGTYTADSAHSAVFAAFADSPNRQDMVVIRPGREVRRIAIHRSFQPDTGSGCAGGDECSYYNSPRASISPDGRYVAFMCNFGVIANRSVCVVDLGFSDDVRITSAIDPADTLVVLRYNVPADQGAATILISDSPVLSSPVVNTTDGLTNLVRQFVASTLTAATDYFYRVTAGAFSYTGRFRTLPALSGTGTLRIERGGGGNIDHGTTSSLGSSGASPLVLTPSKGAYYYNAGAGVTATIVK